MTSERLTSGHRKRYWIALTAVATAAALTALSAPIFWLVSASVPREFLDRLSDAGQAYGILGAIFSALALAAVSLSVLYQHRQDRTSKALAWRNMQESLLQTIIKDPAALAPCIINVDRFANEREVQQYLFTTMWLAFCRTGLEMGSLNDTILRSEIFPEMLESPVGRRLWSLRREWSLAQYGTLDPFYAAIDEEYAKHLPAQPTGEEPHDVASAQHRVPHQRAADRRLDELNVDARSSTEPPGPE